MKSRSFKDFCLLQEGNLPVYMPGDGFKSSRHMHLKDIFRTDNFDLGFANLLKKGIPFTVIVNTEGMKNIDHLHPEMDVIGIEEDMIIVRDIKGNINKVNGGRIMDGQVSIGNSVEDDITLGSTYLVDGKERWKILDYDGKELTVNASGEKKKISIADWKKKEKTTIN